MDAPTFGLNGRPIDFAAYHFDPHTLLAVLLLSLAIAILFVTALIPDRQTAVRQGKALRRVIARIKVKVLQRQRRKSKGSSGDP
jgi:hypothetical protein